MADGVFRARTPPENPARQVRIRICHPESPWECFPLVSAQPGSCSAGIPPSLGWDAVAAWLNFLRGCFNLEFFPSFPTQIRFDAPSPLLPAIDLEQEELPSSSGKRKMRALGLDAALKWLVSISPPPWELGNYLWQNKEEEKKKIKKWMEVQDLQNRSDWGWGLQTWWEAFNGAALKFGWDGILRCSGSAAGRAGVCLGWFFHPWKGRRAFSMEIRNPGQSEWSDFIHLCSASGWVIPQWRFLFPASKLSW